MTKHNVSLSVPVTIYDFGEATESLSSNQYVTPAKLKVFYVGKTPDKRIFSKSFSDALLKTLPHTPVVAYYDEDKEDFVGHNKIQYVFGFVPETATIEYKEENGVKFAISDVLLFTGRKDNIGEIASKIIGHSHSLEMDPETVEYILSTVGGKVDSITFTKGSFIGLSVLGANEKPAFSGSEFFTEHQNELDTFISSFKEFKETVELYKSGGNNMTENAITLPVGQAYQDFMEHTLSERVQAVSKALASKFKDIYPCFIDEIEDEIIFQVWSYADEDDKDETLKDGFYRVKYTIGEDGEATIEGLAQVFLRYLTKDEAEASPLTTPLVTVEDEPGDNTPENTEPDFVEAPVVETEAPVVEVVNVVVATEDPAANLDTITDVVAQASTGTEDDTTSKKEKEDNEQGEKNSNATALTIAERQELNQYRKDAKFQLIDSFEDLSEEVRNNFKATQETFDYESLDKELSFALVKSMKSQKNKKTTSFSVFSMNVPAENLNRELTAQELIDKYKD